MCKAERRDDDVININNNLLHIPPMFFPHDKLQFKYVTSDFSIDFNASDALSAWALKHCDESNASYEVVPCAGTWAATSSRHDMSDEFTSQKWDWTYSTGYNCTILESESKYIMDSCRQIWPDATHTFSHNWIHCEETDDTHKIDLNLLRAKDDIIFFDEILLYQVMNKNIP